MGAALRYLSLVPGDVAPDIAVLKDRIHRSGAADVYHSPEPMFPFIAEDVPIDPSAIQQQQAAAYSQQPVAFSQQPAPAGKAAASGSLNKNILFRVPLPAHTVNLAGCACSCQANLHRATTADI